MAVFATLPDLVGFVPELSEFNVDASNDLQMASDDILNRLKVSWWTQAASTRMGRENLALDVLQLPPLKVSKLNIPAIKNLTCYRALSAYILPKMSSDLSATGDAFGRKSVHFEKMYASEWETVILLPIYDFDGDGNFEEIERVRVFSRKTLRA